MPVPELVFVGVPAYVVHVTGERECDFSDTKSDFDVKHLVKVDLNKNTNEVPWQNVMVDAHVGAMQPGLTTIGPKFHLGSHKGAAHLEIGYYRLCKSHGQMLSWPPASDTEYQYMSIVRREKTGLNSRFIGFRVDVLAAKDSIVRLAFHATMGAPSPVSKTPWLDLGDPEYCDPPEFGYTTIRPVVGSSGALFLSWGAVEALALPVPKLPPGDGTERLP